MASRRRRVFPATAALVYGEGAVNEAREVATRPSERANHMAFRAKCRITGLHDAISVNNRSGLAESRTVTLQPVFGGDDDEANREWSKWTPSGELRLTITNPEVFPELVIGRTFFVTFEGL